MRLTKSELTGQLKDEAKSLGFELAGVCPAVSPTGVSRLNEWLDAGYAGEMHYLTNCRDAYGHPDSVLSGVRSLLMLAINYRTAEPQPTVPGSGRISRYGWGTDYHDLIHSKLKTLSRWLVAADPGAVSRGVVDTAPLMEREFAQLAGLGWIGKNTLLLNREFGSWFFLAAMLTNIELEYDDLQETDHCGTCTACLDACPTDAFEGPYVLDSRKCISYLTIELRSAIPEPLRGGLGDWVFGCDVCQDVCPWNQRAPISDVAEFQPSPNSNPLPLVELFDLDDAQFRARFRSTPLWRARRRGVLRNAAIALGNRPSPSGLSALVKGLNDDEQLVRSASAWALGRHDDDEARRALCQRLDVEADEETRSEIEMALRMDDDRIREDRT